MPTDTLSPILWRVTALNNGRNWYIFDQHVELTHNFHFICFDELWNLRENYFELIRVINLELTRYCFNNMSYHSTYLSSLGLYMSWQKHCNWNFKLERPWNFDCANLLWCQSLFVMGYVSRIRVIVETGINFTCCLASFFFAANIIIEPLFIICFIFNKLQNIPV